MKLNRSTIKAILDVVQLISILVAGAWVVAGYFLWGRVENRLKEIDLRAAEVTNIEPASELKILWIKDLDQGHNLYEAAYHFTLTNRAKLPLHVTYTILEYFVRQLEDETVSGVASTADILRVGSPPNLFYQSSKSQANWRKIGYEAHVTKEWRADLPRDEAVAKTKYDFEDGGGGTGVWGSGETVNLEYMYLVRAKPDDLVGITINMCLECGGKNQRHQYDTQWVRVASAQAPSKVTPVAR